MRSSRAAPCGVVFRRCYQNASLIESSPGIWALSNHDEVHQHRLQKAWIMQSVVVTGVSTGIGWGTTKVLIQHGFRVFGSVRKTHDAERLQKEFGENFIP